MNPVFFKLHDTVYEATGETLSQEQLVEMINNLPANLKHEVQNWGADDTDVCEMIYDFLKEK